MKLTSKPRANQNTLGERIKFFRRRLEMSQMDLETDSGLAPGALSRIERDMINPTRSTIARIAKSLGLTNAELAYLFEVNLYLDRNMCENSTKIKS